MRQIHVPLPSLWHEFGRVQDELLRMFARPTNGPHQNLVPVGPAINIWEDDTTIFAEADLPGMSLDKLEVLVTEGDQLTIQGERQLNVPTGAVWHRQERNFGQFMRQVTLPTMVDADKVEAKYEQGVLRITMPKSAAARPKKITVQAG